MKIKILLYLLLIPIITYSQENQQDTSDWEPTTFFKLFKKHRIKRDTTPQIVSSYYDADIQCLDTIKANAECSELEKDINLLTNISTQKSQSVRSTPSIISIIEEEEIHRRGARDLIDILQLIPGFQFALDKQGRVGIGIRGNWAGEGKILLLIDGLEMNDIYTAQLHFGNHYPVDFIQRIEIIRGPGSAMYGGFAEFGVINIVTKLPQDMKGIYVGRNLGFADLFRSKKQLYIGFGKRWTNTAFSIQIMNGTGQRSDQYRYSFYDLKYIDSLGIGDFSSLKKQSNIDPSSTNIFFSYKNFSVRNYGDFYRVTDVNTLDYVKDHPYTIGTKSNVTELKYNWLVSPKLTIIPKLNFSAQFTETKDDGDFELIGKTKDYTLRAKGSILADYDYNHRLNFVGGLEYFGDFYTESLEDSIIETQNDVNYNNFAVYAQSIMRSPYVNITAGVRYEYNPTFRYSFVPRLGFTKTYDKFHFKLLFSNAFRSPTIGNVLNSFDGQYTVNSDTTAIISIGRKIRPETTTNMELELGYQISSKMFVTANFYNITIRNPIVYHFYQDSTIQVILSKHHSQNQVAPLMGLYVYQNFKRAGTWGAELDFRFKDEWGFVDVNYAFYSVKGKPIIPVNSASTFDFTPSKREITDRTQLLAFAKHKITVNANFYLWHSLNTNISATLYGNRYGYDVMMTNQFFPSTQNPLPTGILKRYEPAVQLNAFVSYKNLLTKGLDFGMGVYDILNQRIEFLQPYFGLEVPLPNLSREIFLKLSYNFWFKRE